LRPRQKEAMKGEMVEGHERAGEEDGARRNLRSGGHYCWSRRLGRQGGSDVVV